MPRKVSNALTPLAVRSAKPGRHADGNGLHLLVKPSGARTWVFRYRHGGKARDLGLGPAGAGGVPLAKARDMAAALRLQVRSGIDPLAERERSALEALAAKQAAEVAGATFRAVATQYIAANEPAWRNAKHRQQWTNTLVSYAYPVLGDLPVAHIETSHVLAVLEPIWVAKPETASRLRGRIEVVIDAAKARGLRQGDNPARWRGHLAMLLPPRRKLSRGHHSAMPYGNVPAFMARLRQREAISALALEFLILTAARTGEVIGATHAEIDLDRALWIVPAGRMKAGREHRVPLSPRAVETVKLVQPLGDGFLFPADRGGRLSGAAMSALLRRMGLSVTVHGFRSAFRDWAAERTAYAGEVAEAALAHVVRDKTEAAYRRGDLLEKRARLMADWAIYCHSDGATVAKISPIRGEAA